MKYIDEFRQRDVAKQLAGAIAQTVDPNRHYRLMEFCGGHTHAIFRYGVQDLMPANVEFIHGPGCPVCVLPTGRIDNAIQLVEQHNVILCTYADLMRVPGGAGSRPAAALPPSMAVGGSGPKLAAALPPSMAVASGRQSLIKAKAAGGDIRMVYSTQDALNIARANPERQVVFFAIGFETTTPPTAVAIKQAAAEGLKNFSVFCNHVLTPAAMQAILDAPEPVQIDAFLGPSHVSSVIGSRPYETFSEHYGKPIVIAGFEPLDVMQSALMLIRQLNAGRHEVENEYSRAVTRDGNGKAQALVAEVFELRPEFEWRGLGLIPNSALRIKPQYAQFDAERRFAMPAIKASDVKGCECPAILRGAKKPQDCKLLGTVCTPENPMGSCMVSSEGACAAYWSYGRVRAG
ncbi:hydrogenase formation protein HypD [Methylomonas koyamae]|uniref:hydrogenase formation protein HypD n=1 Tax=Methylomonas koyamae TaxID=702114 RepID=UPI002873B2F6|nr:hydrogenase formation protein HypD [Methylomonas koyamae]WNB75414.1 hydrogenase formation protein HypD [Methylomonas koyamae]